MQAFLKPLNIQANNAGGSTGEDWWSKAKETGIIESINPTDETVIARVHSIHHDEYAIIKQAAQVAFESWRQVPAPVRGQLVQKMGVALRENKDALGSLVSLEMGKSKQEGDGEVQEMIDMADFAVGQSRMLYGL